MLKTLEEPPAGSVLILIGTSPYKQLPTIRSPLSARPFRTPADRRRAADSVRPSAGGQRDDRAGAAELSAGSVERAMRMMDAGEVEWRGQWLNQLATLDPGQNDFAKAILARTEGAGAGRCGPPRCAAAGLRGRARLLPRRAASPQRRRRGLGRSVARRNRPGHSRRNHRPVAHCALHRATERRLPGDRRERQLPAADRLLARRPLAAEPRPMGRPGLRLTPRPVKLALKPPRKACYDERQPRRPDGRRRVFAPASRLAIERPDWAGPRSNRSRVQR